MVQVMQAILGVTRESGRMTRCDCYNISADTPAVPDVVTPPSRLTKFRNGLGFWLLGLANNYPYVIMLSAAFDIIHGLEGGDSTNGTNSSDIYPSSCTLVSNGSTNTSSYQPRSHCQIQGTSVRMHIT